MQFSSQCATGQLILNEFYSAHAKGTQQPTGDNLNSALRRIIESLHQVYIIIDALDECTELGNVLSWIEEILDWDPGKPHVLTTSRKQPDIEDRLGPRIAGGIGLTRVVVNRDIAIYIRDMLEKDSKLKLWPNEIKEEIANALTDGAHGM